MSFIGYLRGNFIAINSVPPPEHTFNISDDKRADVIINLMNTFRSQINIWNERAFKTTTWSVGINMSILAFWVINNEKIGGSNCIVLAGLLLGLNTLNALYLLTAFRAHRGNGAGLSKCEAALGLCSKGEYILKESFFGYSGKWLTPLNLRVLFSVQLLILIVSFCILLFFLI